MSAAEPATSDPASAAAEALLEVRGLRIGSGLGGGAKTIASGIDLTVAPGEAVAIVGESGSGKSMTARSIVRLLPRGVHAEGEVLWRGRNLLDGSESTMSRVRGGEIGLVFQDPYTMLNPLLRCGRHIAESLRRGTRRGLDRRGLRAEVARRLAEVGIADARVADRYPFELSGGMRQRVGIAASLARNPELLIADEPATALDVTTQKDVLALLKSLQRSRGMGLILITHDLRVAFAMCDRIYVLYAGSLVEVGHAAAVEREPLHPYTLGLFLSEPPLDRRVEEFAAIQGAVADPDDVATSCAFAPRCAWATDLCRAAKPPLRPVATGRLSACVRLPEIRAQMQAARDRQQRPADERASARREPPLVAVNGLRKFFRTGGTGTLRRHEVVALDGVSLEIRANESVGLVGESGSGKTTLGRCIVGLETPTSGELLIDGIDAASYRKLSRADRRTVRRTVQIIFQDPYSTLNPSRTVGATLTEALAVGFPDAPRSGRRLDEILARVGLPVSYVARKPAALSGGERQRVAIARALAANPRMIVCDEPVSALDVSVQAQILDLFRSIRADLGVGYLFITHDLAVVRQIVDRVYVLCKGQVVEDGPVGETLDHPKHPYTVKLMNSIPRSESDWLTPPA
jgi:oligopeptide/dipeptide ABC transporter ATP-binding protein